MAEGPKTPMSARRKSRKRALDVLYEADLRGVPIPDVLREAIARIEPPRPPHLDYAITLVEGVVAHRDRIYELLYADDIDDPVAITEAMELSRQLSTEDSPRFLNGVLGRIAEYASR